MGTWSRSGGWGRSLGGPKAYLGTWGGLPLLNTSLQGKAVGTPGAVPPSPLEPAPTTAPTPLPARLGVGASVLSCLPLQVDSKMTLGLGGVLVVLCAVGSAMGLCAYMGLPSSLVIVEVLPFLLLAVGADNIFIFVLELQVRLLTPNPQHPPGTTRALHS